MVRNNGLRQFIRLLQRISKRDTIAILYNIYAYTQTNGEDRFLGQFYGRAYNYYS